MKKTIIALAALGLLSSPVVAQVNQGQGGAPSTQSGGVKSGADKKMPNDKMKSTTGSSSQNPANGNAGKSGGEGGSGR